MTTTEQMMTLAELEVPKSPMGFLELPCGYLDPEGVLHRDVELSELTGHEEDMLSSTSVPSYKKMGLLVGRCVKRIGTITDAGQIAALADKLTVGDRVYLMFALRKITLGSDYPFRATCPSCKQESLFRVNLDRLDVQKMKTPEVRIYSGMLPSSKKPITYRVLTGNHEEQMAQLRNKDDAISASLWMRLESLDGKPPTLPEVKALSMRDREHIRVVCDEVDGGVDTSIDMHCLKCGHEFVEEVDASQPGFFFPSMTLRKSKTRSST